MYHSFKSDKVLLVHLGATIQHLIPGVRGVEPVGKELTGFFNKDGRLMVAYPKSKITRIEQQTTEAERSKWGYKEFFDVSLFLLDNA